MNKWGLKVGLSDLLKPKTFTIEIHRQKFQLVNC